MRFRHYAVTIKTRAIRAQDDEEILFYFHISHRSIVFLTNAHIDTLWCLPTIENVQLTRKCYYKLDDLPVFLTIHFYKISETS